MRLLPITVQNVVTYSTVIDVPNNDYKLKPGMTATVNIEIARRDDVLRVPNAALRFRPTNDIFAALKQEVPPEMQHADVARAAQAGRARAARAVSPALRHTGSRPRRLVRTRRHRLSSRSRAAGQPVRSSRLR